MTFNLKVNNFHSHERHCMYYPDYQWHKYMETPFTRQALLSSLLVSLNYLKGNRLWSQWLQPISRPIMTIYVPIGPIITSPTETTHTFSGSGWHLRCFVAEMLERSSNSDRLQQFISVWGYLSVLLLVVVQFYSGIRCSKPYDQIPNFRVR